MKKILQFLFEHKTLSREQSKEILTNISEGIYSEHEVTAFITVFLMRSITIEELQGFRDALLDLCVRVDLNGHKTMDIVGTGGDGKNTFNISTLACFVVAGSGQKVAKHGNYGASSISGASNVMEQLGYKFKNDNARLQQEVEEANIFENKIVNIILRVCWRLWIRSVERQTGLALTSPVEISISLLDISACWLG